MTQKRMLIMLIACGVVFGSVFGMKWFGNSMMRKYVENMPIPPATVSAGTVREMTWPNILHSVGNLVAVQGTDVSTEAAGIVKSIHFESGQAVEKGDLLVSLESANEQAEYERLQAQAELAQINRKRRRKLFELEAISKSDFDATVAEARASRAAVAAQKAKLEQKQIRAPFSGLLGIRKINVGQFISAGTAIASLQTLDPIDIEFALTEQSVASAQPGLLIDVLVDSLAHQVFSGEVLAVEPRIDENTRSFNLRARLSNPQGQLRAGQFGRVRLKLQGDRRLLVVPSTAINYNSYGASVFLVEDLPEADQATADAQDEPQATQRVVQRFIKIGESRGDFVAVTQGLAAGDVVATSGLLKLRNHQPIFINNQGQPEPQLAPAPENA